MNAYTPSKFVILKSGLRLARAIYYSNSSAVEEVMGELESHLLEVGYTMDEPVRKRIRTYITGSSITNYIFSLSRGKSPSRAEVLQAIYMGAFTPVADDIMDSTGLTFEELQSTEVSNAEFALFQYLYQKATELRRIKPAFDTYFIQAHLAQNESVLQVGDRQLSEQELEKISFEKGGYYNLWWRTLLDHPLRNGEEEAVYMLGAILQLSNDSFDVYKDYHNKQQTLVTSGLDFNAIEKRYLRMTAEFKQLHFQMDYPMKHLKESYVAWSIILAQGLVAIRNYVSIQGDSAQLNVDLYSRKELITDMQTLPNMWRNAAFVRDL